MLSPPSGATAGSVAYPAEVPNDLPEASFYSLNHVAIGVQDLDAMRRFYVEVSGPGAGPPPVMHVSNKPAQVFACRFCNFVSWPGRISPLTGYGWRQVRWLQPLQLASAVSPFPS